MNKSEIVNSIAELYGLQPAEVQIIVTRFLAMIEEELEVTGGPVKLVKFGSFEVRSTERDWRNPRTGENTGLSARKRVFFTASTALRRRLNEEAKPISREYLNSSTKIEPQDLNGV